MSNIIQLERDNAVDFYRRQADLSMVLLASIQDKKLATDFARFLSEPIPVTETAARPVGPAARRVAAKRRAVHKGKRRTRDQWEKLIVKAFGNHRNETMTSRELYDALHEMTGNKYTQERLFQVVHNSSKLVRIGSIAALPTYMPASADGRGNHYVWKLK